MPGQPQLMCPPPGAVEVDLQPIVLPGGPVVTTTAPFTVTAVYTVGGLLVPFLITISVPVQFEVTFESIGPGPEGSLGILPFNLNAGSVQPSVVCPNPMVFDYNLTLIVPPGALPPNQVFKIVGLVTIPGAPITAFADGPLLSTL